MVITAILITLAVSLIVSVGFGFWAYSMNEMQINPDLFDRRNSRSE